MAVAIEALSMDRRWQLVLDCIDCENAPFSQATLVRFRTALIIQGLDRRLIERTVELAEQTKGFGSKQFPKNICATCPFTERCTTSKTGRSVSIHPDEPLFRELQQRQLTPAGRAKLRERVAVEHFLSHIGRWQGDQARYVGSRKNLFDLRPTAVVHNPIRFS